MSKRIQGVLFDLDGTIYEGSRLIPGADETLHRLEQAGVPYRFVTNTTSKPRAAIVEKLAGLGIEAREELILTAPSAAHVLLRQRGLTRCHFLLKPELLEDLPGIEAVEDSPQAVVIGDLGEGFTFNTLNRAFRLLLDSNCAFLTLARNRCFRTEGGLTMDSGAFTAALEYASGREAELIGKPAPSFYQAATASLGLVLEDVLMIGDDLEADALGAQAAGLQGALVRTGKFREEQLEASAEKPSILLSSVCDIIDYLER